MASATPLRGAEGFQEYYGELFGQRWPVLERALQKAPRKVLRLNRFADERTRVSQAQLLTPVNGVADCYEPATDEGALCAATDGQGLRAGYVMDAASVLAARALEVQPHEDVLDLCAAPGGKAMILLEALGATGSLTLNDRSQRRSQRLRTVLREHAPAEVASRVTLTTRDARRWGLHMQAAYDAVLLDVPCSSERHVLGNSAELAKWSPARIRRLAIDQYTMLASAALALREGGRLIYCTCALTSEENDRVVARLLRKARHPLSPEPVLACFGESTEYGWHVLPDRDGYGPIYFARLRRN